MAQSLDTSIEATGGRAPGPVPRLDARRLEAGALGLLLTTTAGASYALWRGTQLLQALRDAQFEFARHLESDDPLTYPRFVNAVMADWPARLAAHPPTADNALRVALAVSLGFCAFAVLRERPEGREVELPAGGGGRRGRVLARAREMSGFDGRLLVRPDGYDSAISARDAVYVPWKVCQMLDRITERHAAEKLAFVIVHERSHAESLDNALCSMGSVNALLVTGLLAAMLVPASLPAATILLPDPLVRALPPGVAAGLATMLAALAVAAVGTATVGLLTSLMAAREYSADAIAAAVVGAAHLPYHEPDGEPRAAVDPWLRGCVVADRRLHVQGVFARRGALEALAVATWAAARAGLAIATGAAYGPALAVFDCAFLASLGTVLASLPRTVGGVGSYPVLPIANLAAVVAVIGVTLASVDAFAAGKGLTPIFGGWWQATLVAPPCLVMAALCASASLDRRRAATPTLVATTPLRATVADLSLFAASVPSWGISYVVGGLCAFATAGVLADAVVGSTAASTTRVLDLACATACLPLSLLVAKNMRRPTKASAITEAVLVVPIAAAACYVGDVLYQAAAGTAPDRAAVGDLQARLATLDVRALPSPTLALAFAAVVVASWFARRRFDRPRSRPGVRP